jgi:hypothetical protein
MRKFRSAVSGALAAVVTVGGLALVAAPAQAAKPKRIIIESDPRDHRVGAMKYRLAGQALQPRNNGKHVPYASKKVRIQVKKCKKCAWQTKKVLTTNAKGRYRTRIAIPREGRWWWRSNIKGNKSYAKTVGRSWLVRLR